MASSSNNVTFVHFSLIFFVMLSVILGVLSYLNITKVTELRQIAEKEKARATERDEQLDNYQQAFKKLQELAGYLETMKADASDQDGAKSPLDRIRQDLATLGEGSKDLRTALLKLVREIDKRQKALDKAAEDYKTQLATLQSQLQQAQNNFNTADSRVQAALSKNTQIIKDLQEKLDNLTVQIRQLQAAKQKLEGDIQAMEDKHKQVVQDYEHKIAQMQNTIALKQDIIDNLLNISFERPDGLIRWVDYNTNLVWINLGSEDKLPERMTFSVYRQDHHGIAHDSDHQHKLKRLMERDTANARNVKFIQDEDTTRTQNDIKGSIEVTRIVGPHLAEARITANDLYNPIRAGDPIYTPLWSPGVEESFAFAIYLDGNTYNGLNRNLLFRMVKAAGAKISTYVDDEGKIVGSGVSGKDKFLVVTDIPDPRGTADPKERKRLENLAASRLTLEQQARRFGVRIVRLSDFLAYIGYRPDRRLWRPGEHSTRKLKAGAHSTTVNETVGRRQSSGQTSGIYSRRGRLKQPKSTGQTSKIFGGTRGY